MADYQPNPDFEQEILKSTEVAAVMDRTAREVARAVEGAAVFPGGRGANRATVTDGTKPGSKRVGIVGPFGAVEEFGSINSPPKAPLAKGVHAAGLSFEAS